MGERLKGQDVVIRFIRDNQIVTELTAITSFEVEFQMEISSQGFLGETSDRKDDNYNGCRGRASLQVESQDVFNFINDIVNRAKCKTPAFTVNILAVMNFCSGENPKLLFPNVRFGSVPLNISSRTDYVTFDLDWESKTHQLIS